MVLFLTHLFATDDEPFVLHALFVLVSQPRRSEVSECGISIREVRPRFKVQPFANVSSVFLNEWQSHVRVA
jgi:hypothetical protein